MKFLFILFFSCCAIISFAQQPTVPQTTQESRTRQHRNLVKSIEKNLSLPLSDTTEEQWTVAFYAMELTGYQSLWADRKIKTAVDSMKGRSMYFQYALIELLYTNYKKIYAAEVAELLKQTNDPKCFAYGVPYLLAENPGALLNEALMGNLMRLFNNDNNNVYASQVMLGFVNRMMEDAPTSYTNLFKTLLPGEVLMISFQRKNRDYPGIVLIREANGRWLTSADSIFWVPQLARSLGNMPFYLTNGNTPQGLFRINGFDVSKSLAIGPTTNIQLMLPQETTPAYFLKDSAYKDSSWTQTVYEKLLPIAYRNDQNLWQTFIAGKAGRNEIIAHGTTVDPAYYKIQPYYPHTPTLGCLCTKEIWSAADGKRLESDQQKLVDALKKAKGENGYCLVIELDDQQKPVSPGEVVPLLN